MTTKDGMPGGGGGDFHKMSDLFIINILRKNWSHHAWV